MILLVLAVAGLAISVYLTTVHYEGVPLACAGFQAASCDLVTHSTYSTIPGTGLPISLLGIVWFAVSASLALVAWFRPAGFLPAALHLALAAPALAYVIYLVFVEAVFLGHICEWCSAVHLLVALTFLLVLRRLQLVWPRS